MAKALWVLMIGILSTGCAGSGDKKLPPEPLPAPAGVGAATAGRLADGYQRYAARDWPGAKVAYIAAIEGEPSLAEAHYNLALTYDQLGDAPNAKKHYMEAANLAPGNKVIWDAPPLRRHMMMPDVSRKSFLDSNPR